MTSLDQGRSGEAAAAKWFVDNGYDVYMPTFGNAKYDMVVAKDGKTQTVEVKSSATETPSGKYIFQLRKVRSNRTKSVVTNFESDGIDLLVLVVAPTGMIHVCPASNYDGSGTVTLPG